MKKLFFDDVREVPDPTWFVARNVAEAKTLIQENEFDVMSLDHDIGYQLMCEQCYDEGKKMHADIGKEHSPILAQEVQAKLLQEGCKHHENGTTLAQWMIENLQKWPQLVVIHSANPYGSQRMMSLLGPKTRCVRMAYDRTVLRNIRWKDR